MDLKTERKLILNAKQSKDAYGELYNYFVSDVYRYAYSILFNKQNAEDVTSQVFLIFFTKIDTYESKGISVKSWFFQTARNIIYRDYIRKNKESNSYDENIQTPLEYEISFVDKIIIDDMLNHVMDAMEKRLKPDEREIIALRIWEGMQFNQISHIQGRTEDAIKKRFYRGVEKIKQEMEKKGHMKVIALPVLFTSLQRLGGSKAHVNAEDLVYKDQNLNLIEYLKNKSMNTIDGVNTPNQSTNAGAQSLNTSSMLVSNIGVKVVSGITLVTLLVVGGVVGYNLLSDDSNDQEEQTQNQQEIVSSNSTSQQDESPVGEPIETTPTPTPQNAEDEQNDIEPSQNIKRYEYIGLALDLPEGWDSEVVTEGGDGSNFSMDFSCDDQSTNEYIFKDGASCESYTPKNIEIFKVSNPDKRLIFWAGTGLGGQCNNCTKKEIDIAGKTQTYEALPDGRAAFPIYFESGPSSELNNFHISLMNIEPSDMDEVKKILAEAELI